MSEENTIQHNNQPPPQENPLLKNIRIPGETFTLPSQGVFYKNGELSPETENGEIYIYPMVTYDEILFKTPDKIFSGQAIEEVVSRCCPSVLKPLELLARDIDFILVCLRRLTYGDIMEITYTHDCTDAKEQTYKIPMSPFITNSKKLDPTTISTSYQLTLDNGQVLEMSPPRFGNVVNMYQAAMNEDKYEEDLKLLEKDVHDTIIGMIKSVDDVTDKQFIREWVAAISAGWVRKISDSVGKVSDFGPDFTTKVKCLDCKKEIEISTPINPLAFFI